MTYEDLAAEWTSLPPTDRTRLLRLVSDDQPDTASHIPAPLLTFLQEQALDRPAED